MGSRKQAVREVTKMLETKGFEAEHSATRKFDFIVASAGFPFTSHKLLADLQRELEWTGFDAKISKPSKEGKVEFRIFSA